MRLWFFLINFCFLLAGAASHALGANSEIVGSRVGGDDVAKINRTPVQIRGNKGLVVEQLSLSGKPLTRMTAWADKVAISIDRGGKGSIDEWEYYDNSSHIQMSAPYEGHFRFMNVDLLTDSKILSLQFERDEGGEYQLIKSDAAPDTPLYSEVNSEETKPSGSETGDDEAALQPSVKDRISAALKSSLAKSLKNAAASDSCSTVLPSLQKGVERVFLPEVKSQAATDGLRCLRDFGFDSLSDFIDSRFFSPALSGASGQPTWAINCESCPPGEKCDQGKQARFRSQNSRGVPEISFFRSAGCKDQGCQFDENFAAHLFLHEMIHASWVRSETFAEAASDCCAPQLGGQPRCQRLEHFANVRNRARAYQVLYQQLAPETQTQVAQLQTQILAHALDGAAVFSSFLITLAEQHQAVIDASPSTGGCRSEASENCQKTLGASTAKLFDKTFTSHCASSNTSCRTASQTLSHIVVPQNPSAPTAPTAGKPTGRPIIISWPTAPALVAGVAAPTGKIRYRAPIGQLTNSSISAGQNSVSNLSAGGGGAILKFASEGPAMPFYSPTSGAGSPATARAAAMIASAANDQADLIDSFMKRVSRIASSLLSASPARAAAMKVPDPTTDGLSKHLKKVLTHDKNKESATIALAAKSGPAAPPPQVLVDRLLKLAGRDMKTELKKTEVLDELANSKTGVLDENNSRLDRTENPDKWLIYDAETKQFIFRDSGASN